MPRSSFFAKNGTRESRDQSSSEWSWFLSSISASNMRRNNSPTSLTCAKSNKRVLIDGALSSLRKYGMENLYAMCSVSFATKSSVLRSSGISTSGSFFQYDKTFSNSMSSWTSASQTAALVGLMSISSTMTLQRCSVSVPEPAPSLET